MSELLGRRGLEAEKLSAQQRFLFALAMFSMKEEAVLVDMCAYQALALIYPVLRLLRLVLIMLVVNVTVTSTSSYVISTFTVQQKSTTAQKYVPGTYTFSYPKAIISTFQQLANNSTYNKSSTVTVGKGSPYTAYLYFHIASNALYVKGYYTAGGSGVIPGNWGVYNSSGTRQLPSYTITAGHAYRTTSS